MKQRVLSGIVVAVVTVVAAYFGGIVLDAALLFIGLYGSYEFIKIRKEKLNAVLLCIMALSVTALIFLHEYDRTIIVFELIILLSLSVFDDNEDFTDACAVFLMSFLLGYALYFIRYLQALDKWLLGYVLLISYITDTFAYFTGRRFGKHKLIEKISPNKTVEGAIGGWLCGAVVSFIWALIFRFFGQRMIIFVIASLTLPVVSQVGDLVFSMIKRHYGVKDFSDLIPGHGGILDRLDSNIFCIILFGALILLFI